MLEWSHIKNEIRGRGDEKDLIISLTPSAGSHHTGIEWALSLSLYICVCVCVDVVGGDGGQVLPTLWGPNVPVRKPEITYIMTSQRPIREIA